MVEFRTPQQVPTARAAGRVSTAGSQALGRLSDAVGGAADSFSEFYEKEAAIQGELVLAEIQEEWTRGYTERAKQAGAGFAKSTMADYDKFVSDRLAQWQQEATEGNQRNVPARVMDDVQLSLDKYRLKLETQSLKREAAARAAAKAKAVAATERAKLNALIIDPSLMNEYVEGAKTDKQRRSYIKAGLTATMRENPQLVLDRINAGEFVNDLTPDQTQSFIKLANSGIEAQEREAAIVLRGEQARLENELAEELAFAEANGAPPVDSIYDPEAIRDLYPKDPEKAELLIKTYREGVDFAETKHSVALAAPEDIEAEVLRLREAVSKPGDTEADVARLNSYVSAVDARTTQIKQDGAAYVHGTVDEAKRLFELHGEAETSDQASLLSEHYVSTMNLVYDQLGVPDQFRTVLPKRAVTDTVSMLNEMGTDVAAQALTQMVESWGDAAPMVIAQLEKGGLANEYFVAMRHADNPVLTQSLVNLAPQTLADLKAGIPSTDVKDFNTELSDSLLDYRSAFEFGGDNVAIETFNKNYAVAEKYGMSLVRKGTDPATAAEQVISQLFPETVVVGNNMRFIMPDGLDDAKVEVGLERLMREEALEDAGVEAIDDPRFESFTDKVVTYVTGSRSGIWINNSDGTGVQLLISVDGSYIPLLLEDGSPYQVTFKHAESVGQAFGWDRQ